MAEVNTMDDMKEDVKAVFVDKLFVDRKNEIKNTLDKVLANKEEKINENKAE